MYASDLWIYASYFCEVARSGARNASPHTVGVKTATLPLVPPPSPLPPPLLQAPLPLQALGARPLPALPPMSTSKQAEPLDPFRSVFGRIGRGT